MNKEVTKFLKSRNVKNPSRGFPTDAGIDFFVPVFDKDFIESLKSKNPDIFDPRPNDYSGQINLYGTTGYTNVEYNLSDNNVSKIKFDDEKGENYFLLPPHSRILIPSGIHSRMSNQGRALVAANKSGIASKHGVIFGAQVVDYTYKGEIHINVINTSTKNVRIYENMKLIQFLETPVFTNPIEVTNGIDDPLANLDKFYEGLTNDRGAGGFGSTDKK